MGNAITNVVEAFVPKELDMREEKRACLLCGKAYIKRSVTTALGTILLQEPACTCEKDAEEKRKRDAKAARIIEESNIDIRNREPITQWVETTWNREFTEMCRDYYKRLKANIEGGKGIFVIGAPGTGKSWMLSWIMLQAAERHHTRIYFVGFEELSTTLAKYRDGSQELASFLSKLKNVSLLCLDDIGECDIPEWRMKQFIAIIKERYKNYRTTFFTSMKMKPELERVLGEHVVSRITHMCEDYTVTIAGGVDMRVRKNREKQ